MSREKRPVDDQLLARCRDLPRLFKPGTDSVEPVFRLQKTDDQTTEVVIYGDIGWWGLSADEIVRRLGEIETPEVLLRVHSHGGDAFDGIAIYNALARMHNIRIRGVVEGIAASAASLFLMACDDLQIGQRAQLMVHRGAGVAFGNADTLRAVADVLDQIDQSIIEIYQARCGKKEDEVKQWVHDETWFRGQQAVDAGLADGMIPNKKKKKGQSEGDADGPTMSLPRSLAAQLFQHAPADLRLAVPMPKGIASPTASSAATTAPAERTDAPPTGLCHCGAKLSALPAEGQAVSCETCGALLLHRADADRVREASRNAAQADQATSPSTPAPTATAPQLAAISYRKAHPNGTGVAPLDETWDGAKERRDATVDDLKVMCAYVEDDKEDIKGGYKLPHHKASAGHAVVWRGLVAAAARKNQVSGVSADDQAVIDAHLAQHYRDDFDETPPWERDAENWAAYVGMMKRVALRGGVTDADRANALRLLGFTLEANALAEPEPPSPPQAQQAQPIGNNGHAAAAAPAQTFAVTPELLTPIIKAARDEVARARGQLVDRR